MWITKAQWEAAKADARRVSDLTLMLASERLAGCQARADLNRALDMAAKLDDRLTSARMHIAYLEAELAKLAKGSWRWSMSTTKGEPSATND
jgi:hypothetical protein